MVGRKFHCQRLFIAGHCLLFSSHQITVAPASFYFTAKNNRLWAVAPPRSLSETFHKENTWGIFHLRWERWRSNTCLQSHSWPARRRSGWTDLKKRGKVWLVCWHKATSNTSRADWLERHRRVARNPACKRVLYINVGLQKATVYFMAPGRTYVRTWEDSLSGSLAP